MKLAKLVLLALLGMTACKSNPTPAPTPPPVVVPPAPPVPASVCDGDHVGDQTTMACPAGQSGTATMVCAAGGWDLESDTCAAPLPPAPPAATCDGSALGSTKSLACPAGQNGVVVDSCTDKGWREAARTCTVPPAVPPPAIAVTLPLLYRIAKGDMLTLRVAPQAGVSMAWSDGESGEVAMVTPTGDSAYTVKAASAAGATAVASVVVTVQ